MKKEFRLHPKIKAPVRLCGIVEGSAIVRRPGAYMFAVPLRDWNKWIVVDRDGTPL